MKTRKSLIIGVLSSICVLSMGQKTVNKYQADLDGVNVVVLDLDGHAKVTPIAGSQIHAVSTLTTKGKVWGLKSEKTRSNFETTGILSSDTLYVTTPKLFSYTSVGINTYSEKIETSIKIPMSAKIIISNANEIKIESGFASLNLRSAESVELVNLEKDQIHTLSCRSNSDLIINDTPKGSSFEFQGLGMEYYYLKAKRMELNFKK
jgi:hypothetical protein